MLQRSNSDQAFGTNDSASFMYIDDEPDETGSSNNRHLTPSRKASPFHRGAFHSSSTRHSSTKQQALLVDNAVKLMERISIGSSKRSSENSTNRSPAKNKLPQSEEILIVEQIDSSLPAMSEEDMLVLRQSFDLIKADAIDIGALSVQHIFRRIPEASQRFCKNISPAGDGTHTQWDMMENGFVFLSGIERCLLRLSRTDTFVTYVESLTTAHILNYNIRAELLVRSLREFEMVLLTFLQHIQLQHELDVVLATWQRFFDLLIRIIRRTDSHIKLHHAPPLRKSNCEQETGD